MSEQLLQQILEKLNKIEKEQQTMRQELQEFQLQTKNNFEEIKNEQIKTNERLENIEAKQHIIYEQTGKLSEYHTETITQFEQLATKEDLDYFDIKISQHEREIFKLKNRA